jgi:hypothetical protein
MFSFMSRLMPGVMEHAGKVSFAEGADKRFEVRGKRL